MGESHACAKEHNISIKGFRSVHVQKITKYHIVQAYKSHGHDHKWTDYAMV